MTSYTIGNPAFRNCGPCISRPTGSRGFPVPVPVAAVKFADLVRLLVGKLCALQQIRPTVQYCITALVSDYRSKISQTYTIYSVILVRSNVRFANGAESKRIKLDHFSRIRGIVEKG